jgi:hypothetical protein
VILTFAMAWSQEDIDKLKAAIASGILSVTFDGPPRRSITYQSLREMRDLLAEMQSTSGAGTPYRLAMTRKGL